MEEVSWKGVVRPHAARDPPADREEHPGVGGSEDVPVVSAFVPQMSSRKPNPPAPKFGLENRTRAARVQFVTEAHAAMNPTCSPGPKYAAQTCFDNPALAAPAYTFGESREHVPCNNQKADSFSVGPQFELQPGFGKQLLSKNSSAAAYHFSCALREKADRQFVPGFEHDNLAKFTPGPGTHNPKSSIEEGAPTRTRLPAHSFGPTHFVGQDPGKSVCGPGRYNAPSSIGAQAVSARSNQPAFAFSMDRRRGPDEAKRTIAPGVGTYNSNKSSIGLQPMSFNTSAPSFGFGTAPRLLSDPAKVPLLLSLARTPAHHRAGVFIMSPAEQEDALLHTQRSLSPLQGSEAPI